MHVIKTLFILFNKMIRLGTDCSGIEAPIQALKQLKIPFRHVFSCEKDKFARQSILANYEPEILFEDMTTRKMSEVPDIDLYICGFPCQPFSLAGLRGGVKDPRGTIFWHCLKVIKKKLPSVFILENVKGLISINGGQTFKEILKALENLKVYDVYWKVLNTRDYGIPQNRERVFIIGILREHKFQFEWPKERKMKNLRDYVDWNNNDKNKVADYLKKSNLLKKIPENSIFIDVGFTKNKFLKSDVIAPCLNTGSNLWCVPLNRRATTEELLCLQGFPKSFKQVVSISQMKRQIGNSMSVNVLKEILKSIYCK